MSLCVSVVTPEGIVIAGESRQTQVIGNVNRVASESAAKVFELTDTILAATAGYSNLQPQGSAIRKNISSLVDDFKANIAANSNVQTVANGLRTYFQTLYQQHAANIPAEAVQAGQTALNFIVAGYNPGTKVGELYGIEIPSAHPLGAPHRSSNAPGPWWIGQADVVSRIMNGFDPRIFSVQQIQQAGITQAQLGGLQYIANWNLMTVQDAINFAFGMIEVTITIQKFTAGDLPPEI
jgi:hypothetical protein